MQRNLDAMKTALRILTALNDKVDPDPADVNDLHRLAPLLASASIDEIACDVILRALKARAAERGEGASAG